MSGSRQHPGESNSAEQRRVDEWNTRALLGEMGEPVPDDVICPLDSDRCDDSRCCWFGCLCQRLGLAERDPEVGR